MVPLQDLKPRFHTSRLHGSDDFDDDVRDLLLFVSFDICIDFACVYDPVYSLFNDYLWVQDDDSFNVWNLRKCSAAAIDVLSNVFGDEILPALMPLIQVNVIPLRLWKLLQLAKPCSTKLQAKLSTSGDEAWKEREAAVLALGAIAEGCINGLYPHLSEASSF